MSNKQKRIDDSSYNGEDGTDGSKYPYCQVFETECGHTVHYDDTPGNERILIAHTTGSYVEMRKDGGVQSFAVGDIKLYGKSGVTISVDENSDVKIQGHSRMLVGGGAHIEVAGDAGIAVGGQTALVGLGAVNVRAKSMHLSTEGDINMNASGNMEIKATGNMALRAARIDIN